MIYAPHDLYELNRYISIVQCNHLAAAADDGAERTGYSSCMAMASVVLFLTMQHLSEVSCNLPSACSSRIY